MTERFKNSEMEMDEWIVPLRNAEGWTENRQASPNHRRAVAQDLPCARRNHLVGVHVRRGSRAGLEDVEHELLLPDIRLWLAHLAGFFPFLWLKILLLWVRILLLCCMRVLLLLLLLLCVNDILG